MEPIYIDYITSDGKYNFKLRLLSDSGLTHLVEKRLSMMDHFKSNSNMFSILARHAIEEMELIVRQVWIFENGSFIEQDKGKMHDIIRNNYPDLVYEILQSYLKNNESPKL